MAIARLFQTGAELNDTLQVWDTRDGANFTTAAGGKTGSYLFRTRQFYSAVKGISTISQCRMGFYFSQAGDNGAAVPYIVCFQKDGTDVLSLCHRAGYLRVYDGGNTDNLLEQNLVLPKHWHWYHIGIDIKIDVVGWAYVYVDGVEVIGFDGDTTNSGTDFNQIRVGGNNSHTTTAWWNDYPYWDDIWVDSSTGEGAPAACEGYRFVLLNPDGDGYSSDFDGSDGDSVNNYLLVDEIPPDDDTTYVYQSAAGENDGYTCEDITLEPGQSVVSVIPIAVAKKADPLAAVTLDIGERLGGVNQVSSPSAPGTSYDLLWQRHTTKPGGGAWTEADVNNAEMVLETA